MSVSELYTLVLCTLVWSALSPTTTTPYSSSPALLTPWRSFGTDSTNHFEVGMPSTPAPMPMSVPTASHAPMPSTASRAAIEKMKANIWVALKKRSFMDEMLEVMKCVLWPVVVKFRTGKTCNSCVPMQPRNKSMTNMLCYWASFRLEYGHQRSTEGWYKNWLILTPLKGNATILLSGQNIGLICHKRYSNLFQPFIPLSFHFHILNNI